MPLKLTPEMVDTLRTAYAAVDRVDPSSGAYFGLIELLDNLPQEDLRILRDANIKWISSLADARVSI
jgi:hypothetical protein